jgi:intein/homing endonuclease
MMDLAMMGCGTGAILEPQYINQLPVIKNRLTLSVQSEIGTTPVSERRELTEVKIEGNHVYIYVGDSRQGWVKSYQTLLELSTDERFGDEVKVSIDLNDVRPAGEALKGFGGVANPIKLPELYQRCASILNKAIGRQLNSVECCLLIDEAAACVVAGNIRRCLPAGSLVHTESGLVAIEKIRIGDRVLTSKGFYPVTNFFDQGVQSLCRITTEDGHLECTPDHKVAVLTDIYGNYKMVKAKDLKAGDRLVFVPQKIPGTPTELPEFKGKIGSQAKPITVPALTSEVAYFLGYLQGDGSVSSDGWRVRFRIHQDSPQIIERLTAVAELFGLPTYTLKTPEQGQTKAFELQLNSTALNQYLSQFKQPFTSLSVPECILLGTQDIREAYLAGLADADGCHSQGVLVASVHPDFLRQIQTLYASLGIVTRLSASIRKRTGKWEGELVTVGEAAYLAVQTFMSTNSMTFSERQRKRPKSFKDHGFPLLMVKPLVSSYRYPYGTGQKQVIAPTLKRLIPESTELIPVKVKSVETNVRTAATYDIEVATIHEFVCEGILVSNSAGMRQGISDDQLFSGAKSNLWQQDEQGNWRIDPERDSLRMANHTRVFHHKPTLEECIEAVRKQYYSGEGAIQWAGESVARANCDLLETQELRKEFLQAYEQGKTKEWLQKNYPHLMADEIDHRLQRFGLNPCVTADTWVHTEFGPRQVKDLIGKQHGTYVNGELFSTTVDGFFYTGDRTVFTLSTKEGASLRLTGNHQILRVSGETALPYSQETSEYQRTQTQKRQYTEWVAAEDLKPGDRICLHNHRGIQPWQGVGTFEQGWLLGSLVGDGSLAETQWNDQAILRFWGCSQVEMAEYAVATLKKNVSCGANLGGHYHRQHNLHQATSSGLAKLAAQFNIHRGQKVVTPEVEQASYEFYRGFLQGLFDADGSVQGTQNKGISIHLAQSNLELLQAVQRMLLRLGIVSTVYQNRRTTGYRLMPDTNRDMAPYFCKEQHELVIANDSLIYFRDIVGFRQPEKQQKLGNVLNGYKRKLNRERFVATVQSVSPSGIESVYDCTVPGPSRFDANGIVAHNCGEIIGSNFHCNLAEIHLNQIDPDNYKEQEEAFTAGALSVAVLLNHKFGEERYQKSRELDPIVGVSFTGLFDFFVAAFSVDWLHWWAEGRPETAQGLEFKRQEQEYLTRWKEIVHRVVWDYCDTNGLKRPNRCTTVQPSGTKSLLTGASPGWHPPKAQRFIRRITFRKNDPVALACIDYGYSVIPSQSDKDENGNLLNDPFDPRCSEWLVEIPIAVPWADLPGADEIDISQFNALAQMDFALQVQRWYVTHNTSSTWELRVHEIEPLGQRIYEAIQNDEGYISAALLGRFDDHQSFPRLPFEPIDKPTYEQLMQDVKSRRRITDFHAALSNYDAGELMEAGPSGCDSDKCMFPEQQPTS